MSLIPPTWNAAFPQLDIRHYTSHTTSDKVRTNTEPYPDKSEHKEWNTIAKPDGYAEEFWWFG